MSLLRPCLVLLILPLLAACDAAFDNQCDQHSVLDDQVSCMDTAFLALESDVIERRGERERDATDLREELEYCEELRERFADEEWAESNGDDYRERLGGCMDLWERIYGERGDEDVDEDRDDLDENKRVDWDDDEREDLDEDDDEREGLDEDDDEREGLDEDSERGELGTIRNIRERTREDVERAEDSTQRRQRIREGLREGRRWVDRFLGPRDRDGAPDRRTSDDESRPR